MKLTKIKYKKLEELIPMARKPANISNYKFICTVFYIVENGCKWLGWTKKYGKWNTVYVKFNRWSQNGTITKATDFFI